MYGSYIHRTNTKIKVDFQPSRIQVEIDFDKIRIIDYKHIEEKIKKQT